MKFCKAAGLGLLLLLATAALASADVGADSAAKKRCPSVARCKPVYEKLLIDVDPIVETIYYNSRVGWQACCKNCTDTPGCKQWTYFARKALPLCELFGEGGKLKGPGRQRINPTSGRRC